MVISCVWVGSKYPRVYVDRLEAAVYDHTTKHDFKFEVITESELPGWWAKLDLFKPREDRILYFDLDTVIVGNIDPLFEYDGDFAIIKDWWALGYNSSVMSIARGGHFRSVRTHFHKDFIKYFHGDQDWITSRVQDADLWQNVCPGLIGSYKADKLEAGPGNFSVICFHGQPKPHEFTEGWVYDAWAQGLQRR